MAKRSLRASQAGIRQAKKAFTRKGWTQENLAFEVNLKTRQPIWRFFTGQPIERYIFIEICSILELNWREIAENPPAETLDTGEKSATNINALVQQVRSQRRDKIQDQCGTVQLLEISRPVNLDEIYVEAHILEEIASQQWLEITDLQSLTLKDFENFSLGYASPKRITAMRAVESYPKLRILGNPGAGKTTFLQHIAIKCNQGEFAGNRVPVFISLKDFTEESKESGEFSLLNYIRAELLVSGITEPSVTEMLLREGRVLLLLDGLDEVLNSNLTGVYQEIRRFTEKYHKNLVIATCRTAAKSFNFKGFTDVEIAPFSSEQIALFAHKWFMTLAKNNIHERREQAIQFIRKLDLPENLRLRQLVVTPLFLHLACGVYARKNQVPSQESEFYKQCLDLMLGKWDELRGIQRDELASGLQLPHKMRLLSQIAAMTGEKGQYFFDKQTIEQKISDYICQLPNAPTEPEELQLESEGILKAIELQNGLLIERVRGIFSFSHLAFQEYLAARRSPTPNQPNVSRLENIAMV